jgi:hypothetical protein
MATDWEHVCFGAFLLGDAYIKSARILDQFIETIFCGHIPDEYQYVITANRAFGLELYFKCLLGREKKDVEQNHNLRTFFYELSITTQRAIKKEYSQVLKTDPCYVSEFDRLKRDKKNPDKVFGFANVLDKSALAFVKSRYPFDDDHKWHEYLAAPIEIATRRVIVSLEPGWDGALENLGLRQAISQKPQNR